MSSLNMIATWTLVILTNFGGHSDGVTIATVPGFFSKAACDKASAVWVRAMNENGGSKKSMTICVYTGNDLDKND